MLAFSASALQSLHLRYSSAEVKVDIYQPPSNDPACAFEINDELAIRRFINKTTVARLIYVRDNLGPLFGQLQQQTTILRQYAAQLSADNDPGMVRCRLISRGSRITRCC